MSFGKFQLLIAWSLLEIVICSTHASSHFLVSDLFSRRVPKFLFFEIPQNLSVLFKLFSSIYHYNKAAKYKI